VSSNSSWIITVSAVIAAVYFDNRSPWQQSSKNLATQLLDQQEKSSQTCKSSVWLHWTSSICKSFWISLDSNSRSSRNTSANATFSSQNNYSFSPILFKMRHSAASSSHIWDSNQKRCNSPVIVLSVILRIHLQQWLRRIILPPLESKLHLSLWHLQQHSTPIKSLRIFPNNKPNSNPLKAAHKKTPKFLLCLLRFLHKNPQLKILSKILLKKYKIHFLLLFKMSKAVLSLLG